MKNICFALLLLVSFNQQLSAQSIPAAPPKGFISTSAWINGVKIHYVRGGKGKALVLLHGFGQNWYAWNRLLPELSKHFNVIVPDLRGIGESGRPQAGYDKLTMAKDIHALTQHLGFKKIHLAGHDIGEMVAYSYACAFPSEVEKLALLDTPLPGIEPVWSGSKAFSWWWGFNAWPGSAKIIKDREGMFLMDFWPVVAHKKNSFSPAESREFIRAYAKTGAMACSLKWFAAFPEDAKINAARKAKLTMPVLAMGGEYSLSELAAHAQKVALHVTERRVGGAGHWLMQENSPFVIQTFIDFFGGSKK
jgi:pimeloyl-ACP methyl ester carboxylesterase